MIKSQTWNPGIIKKYIPNVSEFSGMNNNITEFLSLLSKSLGGTKLRIYKKKEPNQFGEWRT